MVVQYTRLLGNFLIGSAVTDSIYNSVKGLSFLTSDSKWNGSRYWQGALNARTSPPRPPAGIGEFTVLESGNNDPISIIDKGVDPVL